MHAHIHRVALLLALALPLAVTGCGDKDDTATPPEADTDTDTDADTDSDTDADADSDADTDVATEEDCDDGVDDDKDGLVDCEDGDCADAPICEEQVCDDGLDDEGDGLTDCEDPDCWGPSCHPEGVKVQARGGALWRKQSGHATRLWGGYIWSYSWFDIHGTAQSTATGHATGVVRVLPSGATTWGGGSTISCDWSVASASLGRSSIISQNALGTSMHIYPWQGREGFHLDPGCRLDSSWFVPEVLFLGAYLDGFGLYTDYWTMGGGLIPAGGLWYALDTTSSTRWRTSTTTHSVRTSDHWSAGRTTFSSYRTFGFLITDSGDEILALP